MLRRSAHTPDVAGTCEKWQAALDRFGPAFMGSGEVDRFWSFPETFVTQDDLHEIRDTIEDIDRNIIKLLSDRIALARQVSRIKERDSVPVIIPDQVDAVMERCRALAQKHGLRAEFASTIFEMIIWEMCRAESYTMRGSNNRDM